MRSERGQASVELVALLPLLAVVAAVAWQVVLAGHAAWSCEVAARVAARAVAVRGADASPAAVRMLPSSLRAGARVRSSGEGEVAVTVRVPSVVGRGALTTITRTATFEPQS